LNLEGALGLAAVSPHHRGGGEVGEREGQLLKKHTSFHIYLQEMMESDCKQDEGLQGRRHEGIRQGSSE